MKALGSVIEKLFKDARAAVEFEKKQAERQNELVSHSTRQEIARLKKQNACLSEMLDAERKESMKARDALVKRVSSMLVDFADERERGLKNIVSHMHTENGAAAGEMQLLSDKHGVIMNESAAASRTLSTSVDKAAIESSRAKLSAEKVSIGQAIHSRLFTFVLRAFILCDRRYKTVSRNCETLQWLL